MTDIRQDTFTERIKAKVIGKPRNIKDPGLFHKMALIPILAWIGLGADGLSSSSYGPEEAFRTLGSAHLSGPLSGPGDRADGLHHLLRPIRASSNISPRAEEATSSPRIRSAKKPASFRARALLVDYMLTITVSIVSCGDAIFSFFPAGLQPYKIAVRNRVRSSSWSS